MTVKDFILECASYPYSRESFETRKEIYEYCLLEQYIDNLEFLEYNQEFLEYNSCSFPDDYFQEDWSLFKKGPKLKKMQLTDEEPDKSGNNKLVKQEPNQLANGTNNGTHNPSANKLKGKSKEDLVEMKDEKMDSIIIKFIKWLISLLTKFINFMTKLLADENEYNEMRKNVSNVLSAKKIDPRLASEVINIIDKSKKSANSIKLYTGAPNPYPALMKAASFEDDLKKKEIKENARVYCTYLDAALTDTTVSVVIDEFMTDHKKLGKIGPVDIVDLEKVINLLSNDYDENNVNKAIRLLNNALKNHQTNNDGNTINIIEVDVSKGSLEKSIEKLNNIKRKIITKSKKNLSRNKSVDNIDQLKASLSIIISQTTLLYSKLQQYRRSVIVELNTYIEYKSA